jgi:hypothetical protein
MAFASDHNEPTDFPAKAKSLVDDWVQKRMLETGGATQYDLYVVWFCYILGGWKALVCTTLPDGMYFEVTHNAGKSETYLDAYQKIDNIRVVH